MHQRRLVAESLNTSEGATWSPDGTSIVFSRKGETGADVFLADHDGKNERRITNDQDRNVYNGSPTLSPDGRSIAFHSDNETSAALVVIGVDGGFGAHPSRWRPEARTGGKLVSEVGKTCG